MDKLLSRLLEKYGLFPIAIAVIVGAVIVWSLAHFTAAPGSNISVLWGLVQYTKDKPPDNIRSQTTVTGRSNDQVTTQTLSANQKATMSTELVSATPAPNSTAIHGVTEASLEPALKTLRQQRHLRALETLESGRRLADTPRETYFFVWKGSLRTLESEKVLSIEESEVSRFRKSNTYFEVHLPATGPPIIIAFASESDASRLGAPTNETYKLSIAAMPWEKMTYMVSIPTVRIQRSSSRTINISERDEVDILDIQIR